MPYKHNRLVFNFPGFETTSTAHQIERLTAGSKKTASLWGHTFKCGEIHDHDSENASQTTFLSEGNGWQCRTRYIHFSWNDIIARYERKPYPQNLLFHLPKYLAFFLDGSVFRYVKASWRYGIFTIYPLIVIIVFALFSFLLMPWLLSGIAEHWLVFLMSAFAVFLILCKWPGDHFYINLSINDWAFARDMCNGTNPEINQRYERFAEYLACEISKSTAEEILIVSHSFGSVWAVMALSMALEKEPTLLHEKRITFLAFGSSLLKIGLVRKAEYLRASIARIVREPGLLWHEVQARTDFVSFYKSDPFLPMKLHKIACEVIVHRVSFKDALSSARLGKMKKSMYLAHRQYILYCDRHVHHDFQLRIIGPFFADELARDTDLAFNSNLVKSSEVNNRD